MSLINKKTATFNVKPSKNQHGHNLSQSFCFYSDWLNYLETVIVLK